MARLKNVTVTYTLETGDTMKQVLDEKRVGKFLEIGDADLFAKCIEITEKLKGDLDGKISTKDPGLFDKPDVTDQGVS